MKIRFSWLWVWIVFLIAIVGIKCFLYFDLVNKNYDNSSEYEKDIRCYYGEHPEIFNFVNGVSKINIEDISNNNINYKSCTLIGNPPMDKNFNECVGYFIITKNIDGSIGVDSSHICDLV